MGRELRRVPANWEHPTQNGQYQPMYDEFYGEVLRNWITENKKWEDGTHPDLIDNPSLKTKYPFFAMWHENAPTIEYYRTTNYKPEELTHIQLYENTSEGTPISPIFHRNEFEKLCAWAAENATTFADFKATKDQWIQMLSDGIVYHQEGGNIFL